MIFALVLAPTLVNGCLPFLVDTLYYSHLTTSEQTDTQHSLFSSADKPLNYGVDLPIEHGADERLDLDISPQEDIVFDWSALQVYVFMTLLSLS